MQVQSDLMKTSFIQWQNQKIHRENSRARNILSNGRVFCTLQKLQADEQNEILQDTFLLMSAQQINKDNSVFKLQHVEVIVLFSFFFFLWLGMFITCMNAHFLHAFVHGHAQNHDFFSVYSAVSLLESFNVVCE